MSATAKICLLVIYLPEYKLRFTIWIVLFSDSQMVSYIFWFADMGSVFARVACGITTPPPSHPPRGAARDLLLYHHRVVELAFGETTLLVYTWGYYWSADWMQAQSWWLEMGSETILGHINSRGTYFHFCT